MKALITGAGGFMGAHMVDFLQEMGVEVLATYFNATTDTSYIKSKCRSVECDVRDKAKLKSLLAEFQPDKIYHLAAQSYPTVSWEYPNYTVQANIEGTINLFESVKELKLDPVILVACSSAEYGFVTKDEVPVKESHPLLPLHPYGVSKVAQDLLTYQYFKNFGIKGIRARIFNTTGPRKVNDVCSDFTKRAVMVEKGLSDTITVGNLETQRSITDVRDLIKAFWLLTEVGKHGHVYNLSGEKAYKIQEILNLVVQNTSGNPNIVQDPKLMRPTDEPIIIGDSTKLKLETGWKQEIPLEKTIKDMLEFWRGVL